MFWAIEMRRLLIASGLLVFTAIPVKAETWWLVVGGTTLYKDAAVSYQIPMETETQCEAAGLKLVANAKEGSLKKDGKFYALGYACIAGK